MMLSDLSHAQSGLHNTSYSFAQHYGHTNEEDRWPWFKFLNNHEYYCEYESDTECICTENCERLRHILVGKHGEDDFKLNFGVEYHMNRLQPQWFRFSKNLVPSNQIRRLYIFRSYEWSVSSPVKMRDSEIYITTSGNGQYAAIHYNRETFILRVWYNGILSVKWKHTDVNFRFN
jgi:hypothetical protein